MNKINYKVFIVAIFVLLLTLFAIVQTYALFESDATGNVNFNVGEWVILLNGNDVKETRTISLNDFTYTNGVHTENGYFAPGSTASFDLIIDASDSDVSVEYLIDVDDESIATIPNIHLSVTNLDTNESNDTNSYNGIIRLSDQNKIARLRLNLIWTNQEEYDESDTALINQQLAFDITANFKQYISE